MILLTEVLEINSEDINRSTVWPKIWWTACDIFNYMLCDAKRHFTCSFSSWQNLYKKGLRFLPTGYRLPVDTPHFNHTKDTRYMSSYVSNPHSIRLWNLNVKKLILLSNLFSCSNYTQKAWQDWKGQRQMSGSLGIWWHWLLQQFGCAWLG